MKESDEYKKKIVEFFVNRSPHGKIYKVQKEDEIFRRFGNRHTKEMQHAFDSLVEDKILITEMSNNIRYYLLDFVDKASEIRDILSREPFIERAKMIKPEKSYFEGFTEVFTKVTERAWPNRGTYYYCIKDDDPYYWKVIIRTKPNAEPTSIVLYSLTDLESKITKMWQIILKVWRDNNKKPIYKKMAEDEDQKIFSNNRQPSTAGFSVFEHLGWLKEVGKKGNIIYYDVTDENAHDKFLRDKGLK